MVSRPSTFTANSRVGPQNFSPSTSFTPWRNRSSVFRRPADFSLRPGNCFACGRFGHWRSECPQLGSTAKATKSDDWWLDQEEESKLQFPCICVPLDAKDELCAGEQGRKNFDFRSDDDRGVFSLPSVKGRLIKSVNYWCSIGAPQFVLDIIIGGYKIPFITAPPPCQFRNNASARKEPDFVTEAVLGLLHDNRVEELDAAPEIINPLSVSVQNTGKKRLILDLRHINLHVFKQKFKCEGLHTIKDIFSRNCFVFSFDLKSGYHHVDIFVEHRKYLAFSWDFGTGHARYFQFTVLPFGLSSAPFIFTKLLRPLETHWRSHGIPIAIFFDDGIGAGDTFKNARANSAIVQYDLAQCGFLVNPEKSNWEPKTRFSWIGYTIDTQTGLIHASEERIKKLSSELEKICANWQSSELVHVRLLASIVGQIISLSASCGSVTQIMTRYLHIIINSRHSWNSKVFLSSQGKQELLFWKNNLTVLNGVVFWAPPFIPSKFVFSDASSAGCAAFIQGSSLVFHRNWSLEESQKSSTWRELATIKLSLEVFGPNIAGQRLRWYTDNQNVVRVIRIGSMIKELHELALDILFFLSEHQEIQLDVV